MLASILIVSTASISALRVSLASRTRAEFDRDATLAAEIVRSSEPAILGWLVADSRSVVLPISAIEPRVPVLHDSFFVGGEEGKEVEIRIDAFDVFGRVPFDVMTKGGMLRDLLPGPITEELERSGAEVQSARALDELVSLMSWNPFPKMGDARRDPWTTWTSTSALTAKTSKERSRDLRIGSFLAHENPFPGFLSVHTAPVSYLEAVFAQQKRGGFSKWILPRERGERLSVPTSIGGEGAGLKDDVPRLINESTAWNFRIDVRVGRVRRAYWALYESGSAMEWIASSRVAIP